MEEAFCIRPEKSAVAQAVSVAIIASLAPGPLLAQSGGLEEVIVTATKREESLMDVPPAFARSPEEIKALDGLVIFHVVTIALITLVLWLGWKSAE